MTSPPDPRAPYRWISPDFLNVLFRDPLDPGYAEAARRKAAERTDAGRKDAAAQPRGRYGTRAVFLVALMVVGLVFAVAYRQVVADEPTRTQVRADLEAQIRERGSVTDGLQTDADRLRDEVAALRDAQLAGPEVRRLRELEATTGVVRVTGDGAVVRVDDGPPGVDPATGAQVADPQARILDLDLQRIANGLWAAGAEAIAINDRRLTATATIRSASGTILVDRVPVVGPYEILAIGPDDLAQQFAASQTGRQMQALVTDYGISYEVRAARDLTLPAATAPQLHHATPAGGGP